MLSPVEVTLISQAGVHGIVLFNGRKYLVEIGLLDHKVDNVYIIDLWYLSRENLIKD